MSCCGNKPKTQKSPLVLNCGNIKCSPPRILNCNNGLQQLSRGLVLGVVIKNTWNVPGCGEIATLYAQNLGRVPVGAYLWSADYGYFQIVGYDSTTGKLSVVNVCAQGEPNIGATVPKCTLMILVSSPGVLTSGQEVFLASDFVAPSLGVCVEVKVTSSLFLTQGGNVQVGPAAYLLDEIIDDTTIRICNEGSGFTVGTFVKAFNAAGDYQYPIFNIGAAAVNQASATATGDLGPPPTNVFFLNANTAISLSNASDVKETLVYWTAITDFKGNFKNANTSLVEYFWRHTIGAPSGSIVRFMKDTFYAFSDADSPVASQLITTGVFTLAPLQSHNLTLEGQYEYSGSNVGNGGFADCEVKSTLTTFQKYV